jgi:hypothetical protein
VVSDVIIHAAATSFIHVQILAISHVLHSMRNTGRPKGASADSDSEADSAGGESAVDVSGGGRGGIGCYCSIRAALAAAAKRIRLFPVLQTHSVCDTMATGCTIASISDGS